MSDIVKKIIDSWANIEGNVNSTEEIFSWIQKLYENTYTNIKRISIKDDKFWYYDDYNGEVLNVKHKFFSIKGIRLLVDGIFVKEQPIIDQPEIGYLGIICKEINGVLNFLMQAKIEPGNINCVQISPTIQATKSNFTRAHGGDLPNYFKYFENSSKYYVIYDQIQSEQSSRFYKKRNRNMIMLIDEDIKIFPNFKWMTLGQIKKLMETDNLVNMDTRTVISGISLITMNLEDSILKVIYSKFKDKALFNSTFNSNPTAFLPKIYQRVNNYKMIHETKSFFIPLSILVDWKVDDYGITCINKADFSVGYYDIEIFGREVRHWTQPLFKATGIATFGLITMIVNDVRKFLVRIKPEVGSFDSLELGPSVQWEPTHNASKDNAVDKLFRAKADDGEEKICDVILSEEGGRFFQEQNRNIILEISINEIDKLPDDYLWVDYSSLNYLVQVNNCLNIQLRNLLSLIKI